MGEATAVWINAEVAEGIRQHGAETYPHECCGALIGRDPSLAAEFASVKEHAPVRQAVVLYPLVNRRDDSPRNRFSLTAKDVVEAEQAAKKQGLEVIGWYHSHPDHPARPSEYDREHALPWYSYVIVSVENGAPKEMTSWRLSDDRAEFSAEPIEIRRIAAV